MNPIITFKLLIILIMITPRIISFMLYRKKDPDLLLLSYILCLVFMVVPVPFKKHGFDSVAIMLVYLAVHFILTLAYTLIYTFSIMRKVSDYKYSLRVIEIILLLINGIVFKQVVLILLTGIHGYLTFKTVNNKSDPD
jgi:hypothetical protein